MPISNYTLSETPRYTRARVLFVKEFLGHKRIDTTLLYIQLDKVFFNEADDEFTAKVAKDSEEIKQLLEVGFEYVCEKDGLMFFRKRK